MIGADWRLGALLREASRNVWSPRSPVAASIALAAAIGVAIPALDAFVDTRFRTALADLARDGRGVLTFGPAQADQPVSIDAASCSRLVDDPAVLRAGPIVEATGETIPRFGDSVPVVRSSSSLFPALREVDVVVGSAVPGPARIARLSAADGSDRTAVRAPQQPEGVHTNRAVVTALRPNDDAAGSCVVVLGSTADIPTAAERLRLRLEVAGGRISTAAGLRDSIDPVARHLDRVERFAPLAAGIVGGLVAALITRSRASALATYRLLGTRRRTLVLLTTLEQCMVGGVLASVGVGTSIALSGATISTAAVAIEAVGVAATWVVVGCAASLPVTLRGTAALARDG